MSAALLAWLGHAALPFLLGLLGELWRQWQRDRALADAGAAQQRTADQAELDKTLSAAKAVSDATAALSDDDVVRELTRRLRDLPE